jgi:hypothetical protein
LKFLNIQSKSAIKTEDDARFAFQISNALTQALLEYRMKNVGGGESESVSSTTPNGSGGYNIQNTVQTSAQMLNTPVIF